MLNGSSGVKRLAPLQLNEENQNEPVSVKLLLVHKRDWLGKLVSLVTLSRVNHLAFATHYGKVYELLPRYTQISEYYSYVQTEEIVKEIQLLESPEFVSRLLSMIVQTKYSMSASIINSIAYLFGRRSPVLRGDNCVSFCMKILNRNESFHFRLPRWFNDE